MEITLEQLQKDFAGVSGPIDLYIDGSMLTYIDIDDNRIEGLELTAQPCGCCHDYTDTVCTIPYALEDMIESDIADLIEQLQKLQKLKG